MFRDRKSRKSPAERPAAVTFCSAPSLGVMSMAGRLAERYTAWAVEVTKMAQASSLFTAWWRHSVPDRALVESRFTTSTPMHSNPRTKATTRRVFSSFRFTVTIYVSCLRPWKSNGDYMDSPLDRISRGIDPESIV